MERVNVFKIAGQVAAALDGNWAAKRGSSGSDYQDAHIVGPDRMEIALFMQDERLNIQGHVSSDDAGCKPGRSEGFTNPKITVSPERAPARIAGEIERRVLPEFRKFWTRLVELREQYRETEAREDAFRQELLSLLPGAKLDRDGEIDLSGVDGVDYGSFQVLSSGISTSGRGISMDADAARKFFRALAKF